MDSILLTYRNNTEVLTDLKKKGTLHGSAPLIDVFKYKYYLIMLP